MSWLQPHVGVDVGSTHTGIVACVAQTELFSVEQVVHCPASGEPVGWHAGEAAVGHESGPGFDIA